MPEEGVELKAPAKIETPFLKTEIRVRQPEKPVKERLKQHRKDIAELINKREELRLKAGEKAGETGDTETHWQSLDDKTKAAQRLGDFNRAQVRYEGEIAKPDRLIRAVKAEKPSKLAVVKTFIGGIVEDWQKKRADKKEVILQGTAVKLRIVSREEILNDPQVREFLGKEENQAALANLFGKEVFREINCTNIMMVEGVTPGQFRQLIRQLGGNPLALASDRRGNNEGAIAIDNKADTMKRHPFYDMIKDSPWLLEEMKYWKRVLPGLPFRVSRTHSLIYGVKDSAGKDTLLLPAHIDPKNWVAGPSASKFHQVESLKGPDYVGTGEYDLASAYLIKLLDQAREKGLIQLEVSGQEKLRTTGSIVGDNFVTEAVAKQVRKHA